MLQAYNIEIYPQQELILRSVTYARYQLKRLVNYTSLMNGEKRLLVQERIKGTEKASPINTLFHR